MGYRLPQEYLQLLQTRREHFREIIGAVDLRTSPTALELMASTETSAEVASGEGYRVFAVRWPVFEDVMAEGLLLQPDGPPIARIVALPDADSSSEMLVGLAPGVPPAAQFARRLAAKGCLVVVPCADESPGHLVWNCRNSHDQPASPRISLPDGV